MSKSTNRLRTIFPFIDQLQEAKKGGLKHDLIAGTVIGIMIIPQGMAYALIAGLPPIYGLYSSLIPPLIYFILGTSRKLVIGPVAIDAMMAGQGLAALGLFYTESPETYITSVFILTMMIGVIQLAAGFLKLGFISNFLSEPVIKGFTTAAAFIIIFSQTDKLLGIETENTSLFHSKIWNTLKAIPNLDITTAATGLGSIVAIILIKKTSVKNWSVPIVVVGAMLIVLITQMQVDVVGTLPKGFPKFTTQAVSIESVTKILPLALTIALIGFTESITIAKGLGDDPQKLKANQELIALGGSNLIGSFFQSFNVGSSFSRSALNAQSGAKTTLSGVVAALFVGIAILFLTDIFQYLPYSVLGAIIISALFKMIDFSFGKYLFRVSKEDFVIWFVTFLITLEFGVVYGIGTGALIALFVFISKTFNPHIAVLGKVKETVIFRNVKRFEDLETDKDILILRFDSPLYYVNIDSFISTLREEIDKKGSDLKLVIISASAIPYIDSSAMHKLEEEWKKLSEKGILMYFASVQGPVRDTLLASSLGSRVGQDSFFASVAHAIAFHKKEPLKEQDILNKIAIQRKS